MLCVIPYISVGNVKTVFTAFTFSLVCFVLSQGRSGVIKPMLYYIFSIYYTAFDIVICALLSCKMPLIDMRKTAFCRRTDK